MEEQTEAAKQPEAEKEQNETVKETVIISSPITGIADELSTAPDEAFAGKMMGDGAVVTPVNRFRGQPSDSCRN